MQQANRHSDFHVAPVLVWPIVQLAALMISAFRFQLWARMPVPAENYALPVMIAAQFFASALLFPWLMREVRSAAFVILVTATFVQLAGMLGGNTGSEIVAAIIQQILWLASLLLWRSSLRSAISQLVAVGVASGVVIGGSCLAYLRMEFATNVNTPLHGLIWALVTISFIAGALAGEWTRRRSYPQSINTSSTSVC